MPKIISFVSLKYGSHPQRFSYHLMAHGPDSSSRELTTHHGSFIPIVCLQANTATSYFLLVNFASLIVFVFPDLPTHSEAFFISSSSFSTRIFPLILMI